MNTLIEKLDKVIQFNEENAPDMFPDDVAILSKQLIQARGYASCFLEIFDKEPMVDGERIIATFDLDRIKDPRMLHLRCISPPSEKTEVTRLVLAAWRDKEARALDRIMKMANDQGQEDLCVEVDCFIHGYQYNECDLDKKYTCQIYRTRNKVIGAAEDYRSETYRYRILHGEEVKTYWWFKEGELKNFLTQMAFQGELIMPESLPCLKREE